jgi:hypothetical protein
LICTIRPAASPLRRLSSFIIAAAMLFPPVAISIPIIFQANIFLAGFGWFVFQ